MPPSLMIIVVNIDQDILMNMQLMVSLVEIEQDGLYILHSQRPNNLVHVKANIETRSKFLRGSKVTKKNFARLT